MRPRPRPLLPATTNRKPSQVWLINGYSWPCSALASRQPRCDSSSCSARAFSTMEATCARPPAA
eukprot:8785246-Pyramimonas_sp.AAC.1